MSYKDLAGNKQFWRTVKPLLSDKIKSNEKIYLVTSEEILGENEQNVEGLKSFFSSVVQCLRVIEYTMTNIFSSSFKFNY